MALEQTWRWFGPQDPVTLPEIKQSGATGIVSALHHIPVGEIWPVEEISKRREMIENSGLTWSVVESLPVHENIKKREDNYRELVDNYKQSIINLAHGGIDTICYNFMPVLDWSRTDLDVEFRDGSITTKFESKVFAAFDLFILQRPGAEADYSAEQLAEAQAYFETLSDAQRKQLAGVILLGFPGSLQSYSFDDFKKAILHYQSISTEQFRENLYQFIREIVPVAEENGAFMAIHPDDPPWSLLGLPRIVSTRQDLEGILAVADSPANGLTLCTGSLGASVKNDLPDITKQFAGRINFIHLRNLTRKENGDFMEDYHLSGDVDIYAVMKTLILEQKRRAAKGSKNRRMPMRPDHGNLMIPEQGKEGIYPGYSLFGRMRGLAELRGLEIGIERSLES